MIQVGITIELSVPQGGGLFGWFSAWSFYSSDVPYFIFWLALCGV